LPSLLTWMHCPEAVPHGIPAEFRHWEFLLAVLLSDRAERGSTLING
jgi:hypothetical protein